MEARTLKQNHYSINLQRILLLMYTFNATNPCNKIFALLGIVTDTEDSMLDPDYNTSVEAIYLKTAVYLLKCDNYILLLYNAGIGLPMKYKDLPSWVP
jgi:hypothetical protein